MELTDENIPSNKKRRSCEVSESEQLTTNPTENNAPIEEKEARPRKKCNPKFRLKATGEKASVKTCKNERVPVMLTDIQHLLLHSLFGNLNLIHSPRWYALDKCNQIKQTMCFILEGISILHLEKYSNLLEHTNRIFDDNFVELLTPSIYGGSLIKELALVPLSEAEKDIMIQKYGSMNLALEVRKDLNVMMKAVFPIKDKTPTNYTNTTDKFPRTQLILSASQLVEESYPVPLKGKLKSAYSDYVMSKDSYIPVTNTSPMFGLDCEMCITNAGSELTRVSIVNEKHETIYETLVKPYNNITDYLTRYSGITKSKLNDVTKRLEEVQIDLRNLLPPDAILIGQSLNIDLHALKMMHPYIIDTSFIYNFTGERTRKPKLKVLAKEFLNKDIQQGKSGHCSLEDAITAMKLVQLKLSKNVEYGDAVHTNRQKYKENSKIIHNKEYALSIFNHMIEQKKSSVVIGCDNITGDYHTYMTQAKETINSQLKNGKIKKVKLMTVDCVEEVVPKLQEVVCDYNLAMAHLILNVNECELVEQIKAIDNWIHNIWLNIAQNSLCVVVLGGTSNENGVAMMKVKD